MLLLLEREIIVVEGMKEYILYIKIQKLLRKLL